jgi:hypothetical protein
MLQERRQHLLKEMNFEEQSILLLMHHVLEKIFIGQDINFYFLDKMIYIFRYSLIWKI